MAESSLWRTGRLVGCPVRDARDESLGRVEDLVADVASGRLAYGVLSFGDKVGDGESLYPVPWSALRLSTDGQALVLAVAPERLRDAPGFPRKGWPDLGDPRWRATIDRYYFDDEPYLFRRLPPPTRHTPAPAAAAAAAGAGLRAIWIAVGILVVAILLIAAYAVCPWDAGLAASAALSRKVSAVDLERRVLVREALQEHPELACQELRVAVRHGVVVLSGKVRRDVDRARSEAVARGVPGVRQVLNRLQVAQAK